MTTTATQPDVLSTYCAALIAWRKMDTTNSTYRERMDAYAAMAEAHLALRAS